MRINSTWVHARLCKQEVSRTLKMTQAVHDEVDVKKTVRALLVSARNGLTPAQLEKDYESMIGTTLPYKKLGYNSLMEFIEDSPDVVSIQRRRGSIVLSAVVDESSAHLARMISRQKNSKPYNHIKPSQPVKRIPSITYSSTSKRLLPLNIKNRLKELLTSYPNGLPLGKFQEAYAKRFGHYLNVKVWDFKDLLDAISSVNDIVSMKSKVLYSVKSSDIKSITSLNSLEITPASSRCSVESVKSVTPDNPKPVPTAVIRLLYELLEMYPNGMWVSDITAGYKNCFDEELPIKRLGYRSIVEMLDTLGEVIELTKPNDDGDWMAFIRNKNNKSKVQVIDSAFKIMATVPNGLINVIHRVLEATTSQVTVGTFSSFFKEATNRDLPIEEYGFTSVLELLKNVPGLTLTPSDTSKDFTIMLASKIHDIADHQDKEATQDKTNEEEESTKPSFCTYSQLSLPKGSKTFGVYVTFVKTPSCFFIQVIGEDTTQTLDSLHEDMAQFYNSMSGDKCAIDNPMIGQPCCSRFNNDGYWYRAKVIGKPEVDVVEVEFVDYGNTGSVPKKSIRQPKPHYIALPAQAIRCRLANIMPLGSSWSKKACQLLFEMTKEKPIAAVLASYNDEFKSLCLCDTTTDKDIHINDCLVDQGLALFSPDGDKDVKVEEYKMESPPPVLPEDVRLPKTSSSGDYYAGQGHTFQQQHLMLQLMSMMQHSLNLQRQQQIPFPLPPGPPPGFERRTTSINTNQPLPPKEYLPIFNTDKQVITKSFIKKIIISPSTSLHVIRHLDKPYVLSKEISLWFWESDLLHYKLHKIPNSPCSSLIYHHEAPVLFNLLLKSNNLTIYEIRTHGIISVYLLEELPTILELLKCPETLQESVASIVKTWRENKASFWNDNEVNMSPTANQELLQLTDQLKQLQEKRTLILANLMKKSTSIDLGPIVEDNTFEEMIEIDKKIKDIQKRLQEVNAAIFPPSLTRQSHASSCGAADSVIPGASQEDHPDGVADHNDEKDSLALSDMQYVSDDSLSVNSTVNAQSNEDSPQASIKPQPSSNITKRVSIQPTDNFRQNAQVLKQPTSFIESHLVNSVPKFQASNNPYYHPVSNKYLFHPPPTPMYHPSMHNNRGPPLIPHPPNWPINGGPPLIPHPPNWPINNGGPPLIPHPPNQTLNGGPPLIPHPPTPNLMPQCVFTQNANRPVGGIGRGMPTINRLSGSVPFGGIQQHPPYYNISSMDVI